MRQEAAASDHGAGVRVLGSSRMVRMASAQYTRLLYGTVMHEGADRGILVTTSDYGADSVSFVSDKPLTLINGAQLLSLLEKHGHKARIDLDEAREQQADQNRRSGEGPPRPMLLLGTGAVLFGLWLFQRPATVRLAHESPISGKASAGTVPRRRPCGEPQPTRPSTYPMAALTRKGTIGVSSFLNSDPDVRPVVRKDGLPFRIEIALPL